MRAGESWVIWAVVLIELTSAVGAAGVVAGAGRLGSTVPRSAAGASAGSSARLAIYDGPFTVTFTEVGLASATPWNVTFDAVLRSSTASTLTFADVPAGPTSYTVGAVSGYAATPSGGTIDVESNASGPTITFTAQSPHAGEIVAYELAPYGSLSEDPAVDYESVGAEPVENVYEPLVSLNGTNSSNYIPVLSTCVPGTAQCTRDYGSDLVVDGSGAYAGEPVYWTFPIDPSARFYDPATKVSWPVYPSDVMFSVARDLAFEGYGSDYTHTDGWATAEALLPNGNSSWDGGLHAPLNSTPGSIFSSMLVNDSAYCPTAALVGNGCITFVATGEGVAWPFFLQLVSDPFVGSVVPCGWFTAEGAGLPGWAGTHAPHGDGSCLLPDGGTTTDSAAWSEFLATVDATSPGASNATSWDALERGFWSRFPAFQPNVQWKMVGSGPYYAEIDPSHSYVLAANPAYAQPSGCSGTGGLAVYVGYCYPARGAYIPEVSVVWENNTTVGLNALESGRADYASFVSNQTGKVETLAAAGRATLTSVPTIGVDFAPFNLNWSPSKYVSEGFPDASSITIPRTFFTGLAARELLEHAYPYDTVESQIATVRGVSYLVNSGGPIPVGMAGWYPTNVSYASAEGDPGTNPAQVGSAAWWWAQGRNASSPYFDPALANCTTEKPCVFPIADGTLGNGSSTQDWIDQVVSLTEGAVAPFEVGVGGAALDNAVIVGPTENPFPIYSLGWLPDYYDPNDYMLGMVDTHGFYAQTDDFGRLLERPGLDDNAACGHSAITFADLAYWAVHSPAAQDCQGVALSVAENWTTAEASAADSPSRHLDYNLIVHIVNGLGLYTWEGEIVAELASAPWINASTLTTNVILGGGYAQLWFHLGYLGTQDDSSAVPVGSGPDAEVYDPFNGDLFEANYYSDSVGVLSSTGTLIASIPVGSGPRSLAVDPTNGDVCVANFESENLTVINGTTERPAATLGSGTEPFQVVFDPVGPSFYVLNYGSGNVTVVSADHDVESAPVAIGSHPAVMAVDTANGEVFVSNGSDPLPGTLPRITNGNVTIVRGDAIDGRVHVGRSPEGVAYNTYNGEVYVANVASDNVSVIGGASHFLVATVHIPSPGAIVYDPVNHDVYVAGSGAQGATDLYRINATTNTVSAVIAVDPEALAVNPLTGAVYALDESTNSVSVVSAATNRVVATVTVGSDPVALTVDPVTGTVWVADEAADAVSIIPAVLPTFYSVRFVETGLPAGTPWGVTIEGTTLDSVGPSISFDELNGSYPFTVDASPGFVHSPTTGYASVNGGPVTVPVAFGSARFALRFVESGLPLSKLAASGWSVVVNGTAHHATQPTIVVTGLTNGSYPSLVSGPAGYRASGSTGGVPVGLVRVDGPTVVPVTLSRGGTSDVVVKETGIPSGRSWCLTLEDHERCTLGRSLEFGNLTPAAYAYAVVSPAGNVSLAEGKSPLTLNGTLTVRATTRLTLTYAYTYPVTFREDGLSTGTWSVKVKSQTGTAAAGDPVVFYLPNGSYKFKVTKPPGWSSSTPSPRFTISGHGVMVAVEFVPKDGAALPGAETTLAPVPISRAGGRVRTS